MQLFRCSKILSEFVYFDRITCNYGLFCDVLFLYSSIGFLDASKSSQIFRRHLFPRHTIIMRTTVKSTNFHVLVQLHVSVALSTSEKIEYCVCICTYCVTAWVPLV